MSDRPQIPAEIKRLVFIESGHRCAVDGRPTPLELAHIIPWHKSREHKAADLICLCANCHGRSHREKWDEKTLREYKERPWVMRQYKKEDIKPEPKVKVRLLIDMELEEFDEETASWLQSAIAGFLAISPDMVRKVSIEKGSLKVTIELPESSAEKLLDAYEQDRFVLTPYFAPLVLLDLCRVEAEGERIQARTAEGKHVLKARFGILSLQVAAMLLDMVFVGLWVGIQFAIDYIIIQPLGPSGIGQWVLNAFKLIFGLSTLAPIAYFIFEDIAVIHHNAKYRIEQQKMKTLPSKEEDNE